MHAFRARWSMSLAELKAAGLRRAMRRPHSKSRGAHPSRKPWVHKKNVAMALAEALLARNSSQLNVLQIGANLGDFNVEQHFSVRSELKDDTTRMGIKMLLDNPNTRAVLVEANPSIFGRLNASLTHYLNGSTRMLAVNAVACEREASKPVNFYRVVPERLLERLPHAPYWAQTELNSMDLALASLGLKAILPRREHASVAAYFETLKLPCEGPQTLLRRGNSDPAALDVLYVDIEGYDANIVDGFLNVSTFRPKLVSFEAHIAPFVPELRPTLRRVLRWLVLHGYRVACCNTLCGGFFFSRWKRQPSEHFRRACGRGDHNAMAWDPRQLNDFTTRGTEYEAFEWDMWGGSRMLPPAREQRELG